MVVFNSCAVTAEAGRKSRQRVRGIAKRNPTARIAVTGCWATLQSDDASALPGVAMVVDNDRKDLLHILLEPWSAELDDRHRAMLDLADKLTRTPHEIDESDRQGLRDAGFAEKDIWDIANIAGFYNMTNRVASAVDMQPNKEYHGMHR